MEDNLRQQIEVIEGKREDDSDLSVYARIMSIAEQYRTRAEAFAFIKKLVRLLRGGKLPIYPYGDAVAMALNRHFRYHFPQAIVLYRITRSIILQSKRRKRKAA